jgi:hypothetical protein
MLSQTRGPLIDVADSAGLGPRQDDLFFAAVTATRTPMLVADARLPDCPIICKHPGKAS